MQPIAEHSQALQLRRQPVALPPNIYHPKVKKVFAEYLACEKRAGMRFAQLIAPR